MLAYISMLAAVGFYERLSCFLFTFGIWDIFYYIFLKILIDWPETLLDWDILFLIPVAWVAPVLAPIICSLMMIVIASLILRFKEKGKNPRFSAPEWFLVLTGSIVIFYTFIHYHAYLIFTSPVDHASIQSRISEYAPVHFQWFWFSVGFGLIIIGIYIWSKRILNEPDMNN
jgi:hypothetical protein